MPNSTSSCPEQTIVAEFAAAMATDYPDVKPGTALWQLHSRDFDRANSLSKADRDARVATAAPAWSEMIAHYARPDQSEWQSLTSYLSLDAHPGVEINSSLVRAQLGVQLVQPAYRPRPFINVSRYAGLGKDRLEFVEGSTTRLTLGEAAELAHLLLLMVDVAKEN